MIVTVVNNYGKASNIIMSSEKFGADKYKCQDKLKQYFAGLYTKRGIASFKIQPRRVHLSVMKAGFFSDSASIKTFSLF